MQEKKLQNLYFETNLDSVRYCGLSRSKSEILDLLDNNIDVKIDLDAFTNTEVFKNITVVDLNHNYLRLLKKNMFLSLINVTQLDLSYCNLCSLEVGTFNGLVNCQELFMFSNSFETLQSDVFTGLTNVERIYLSDCKNLRNVRGNTFRGLDKLIKIDMNRSNIGDIDLDEFKGLKSLQCLVISNKKIPISWQSNGRSYEKMHKPNEDFIKRANQSNLYSFSIC